MADRWHYKAFHQESSALCLRSVWRIIIQHLYLAIPINKYEPCSSSHFRVPMSIQWHGWCLGMALTSCCQVWTLHMATLLQPGCFSHSSVISISHLGFITDGNSKLVGSARIRQVRVKGDSCPISPILQRVIQECHAPYSLQTEDTSDYGEHWNTSVFDISSDLSSAWHYQSQSKLRGQPVWGKLAIYGGGGYVIHLGTDPQNASR